MPGREGSRCLTRQEQVASYSRALVMTAATATILRAAVLLRRMSLSRSRVCPGVCTKAHEGVFQGAPRGGAHTSPPGLRKASLMKETSSRGASYLHCYKVNKKKAFSQEVRLLACSKKQLVHGGKSWSCPACHDLSLDEEEVRSHALQHDLFKATWSPTCLVRAPQ
jgi:hypothetical protein